MKASEDPITAVPAIRGVVGNAWLADIDAMCKRLSVEKTDYGTVAVWCVEATWAHPSWHTYRVVLIHLRTIYPDKPTILHLPDATHELWLHAMNPDTPRQPQIEGADDFHILLPMNFAAQIVASSDAAAMERVEKAVTMVCNGQLSPDTDHTRSWVALFGDNMLASAARG